MGAVRHAISVAAFLPHSRQQSQPGKIRDTDPALVCIPGYPRAHRVWRDKIFAEPLTLIDLARNATASSSVQFELHPPTYRQ